MMALPKLERGGEAAVVDPAWLSEVGVDNCAVGCSSEGCCVDVVDGDVFTAVGDGGRPGGPPLDFFSCCESGSAFLGFDDCDVVDVG